MAQRSQTQGDDAFNPEHAGIMPDRLATELLRAHAKNPETLPNLKRDALELLVCVAAWLSAAIEPEPTLIAVQGGALEEEPLALATLLRDVAEQLLLLDEAPDLDDGQEQ